MMRLRTFLISAVLIALIGNVSGRGGGHAHGSNNNPKPCTNNPQKEPWAPPCSLTSTTTEQSTSEDNSDGNVDETTDSTASVTTASDPTLLERAHWCRLSNGTYLPLGHTYMHSICTMCECTSSRAVRCRTLQCLPTYCIDNTMPYRKDGQCCAQCSYEVARNSCAYNGALFPHGVILKTVENKVQCWCQLGNIECRDYIGSFFDSMDMFADERAVYIIVIVLSIVLILGSLVCCCCTFCIYYYYQRNQDFFQQSYDQYFNSAGWQPMNEEEQTEVDGTVADKQAEADQYQSTDGAKSMVPPPYSAHNESFAHDEQQHK